MDSNRFSQLKAAIVDLLPGDVKPPLRRLVQEAQRKVHRLRGKEIVHFMHIGKTGGTAVKYCMMANSNTKRYVCELHSHDVRLRDIPKGDRVAFFLRDPIRRYISAFNSRKVMAQPRYYYPWTPSEAVAFANFSSPNELARALSSEGELRIVAEKAMKTIRHVKSSFWDWFESREYFLSRLPDIFFIGFQESLVDDFEVLKEKLGLPKAVRLPEDDVEANRGPSNADTWLDRQAIRNLKEWYAKDFEFMRLCRETRQKISGFESDSNLRGLARMG